MTVEEQAKLIAKSLVDKKATDVKIYDVRDVSGLCDYYVIATGAAAPHLKALIADTQRTMKEVGVNSYRTSGDPDSGWIVVDYVDIVVHTFSPEARMYYALDKIWTGAKTITVE